MLGTGILAHACLQAHTPTVIIIIKKKEQKELMADRTFLLPTWQEPVGIFRPQSARDEGGSFLCRGPSVSGNS